MTALLVALAGVTLSVSAVLVGIMRALGGK